MENGTASMTAALVAGLLRLDGFTVLGQAEIDGERELLVETTADLVRCPGRGAVAGRRTAGRRGCAICRWPVEDLAEPDHGRFCHGHTAPQRSAPRTETGESSRR
jgi:hypothetical protein